MTTGCSDDRFLGLVKDFCRAPFIVGAHSRAREDAKTWDG
jgi:hypothetical protein